MSVIANIANIINRFLAAMELEVTPNETVNLFHALQHCLRVELVIRHLFAIDRQHPILVDPYIGIFDIFDLKPEARLSRPRNWDEEEGFVWDYYGAQYRFPEKYILPIEPRLRLAQGDPCIVGDLSDFRVAWDVFSGGALSAIRNWDNIIVAGGSVLACLTVTAFLSSRSTVPPSESVFRDKLFDIYQSADYKNSDIDLFLWGLTEEQAKRKMEEIFDIIDSSTIRGAICFRTKNTITIQTEFPRRPVQIILRLYKSPAEILCGFDVDCCCVAYNGTNVFTNPRGLISIARQCNTINLSRRSPSYEHRLMKYSTRGYEIFYPDLDRSRINYGRLADLYRTSFPKGLGRLIVYEIILSNYTYFPMLYHTSRINASPTPIPLESLRHSNYDYAWCKIPYGENWWDPRKVREHVRGVTESIIESLSERLGDHDPPLHFHAVTFGTMKQCLERCCNGQRPADYQLHPDLPSLVFQGPPEFVIDDPGRQLTGSFNSISDNANDWEFEAYQVDDERIPLSFRQSQLILPG